MKNAVCHILLPLNYPIAIGFLSILRIQYKDERLKSDLLRTN